VETHNNLFVIVIVIVIVMDGKPERSDKKTAETYIRYCSKVRFLGTRKETKKTHTQYKKTGVLYIPVVMKYGTVFDGQYLEAVTLNEGHKHHIIIVTFWWMAIEGVWIGEWIY
jgi:hypothetical protein